MEYAHCDTESVLVLWDIDHTLIETCGVGRAAFAAAFEQVTGRALEQMPHITGRTEPDIYAASAELHEIHRPPPFSVFADSLAAAYRARQDQLRRHGCVMPGAKDALTHLAGVYGVRQSVLTGNTRAVSRIKLETFGLHVFLDLETGAYGDDNGHRPELVSIAQSRATSRYASEFDQRNTVLIGDSPGDIETAVKGGAHIIAVAAGGTPASSLADADLILDDLTDAQAVAKAIHALVHTE
ncbi:haloacid dehalogenase-like hydrolase [Nocardia sp. NPDC051787]|uniref:haloacid dehalogenase-like hydrolase n=1 Tax=Nocardia sp. NPDC051787 TaxID=3155415 RepID=UPI003415C575